MVSQAFLSNLSADRMVSQGFLGTLSANPRATHCFLSSFSVNLRVIQGFLSADFMISQGFLRATQGLLRVFLNNFREVFFIHYSSVVCAYKNIISIGQFLITPLDNEIKTRTVATTLNSKHMFVIHFCRAGMFTIARKKRNNITHRLLR